LVVPVTGKGPWGPLGNRENQMNNQTEWMTSEEFRHWLGLGKTKTQELLQSGAIPSYRIGRRRIIRREDVERFLEQNRYEPGA